MSVGLLPVPDNGRYAWKLSPETSNLLGPQLVSPGHLFLSRGPLECWHQQNQTRGGKATPVSEAAPLPAAWIPQPPLSFPAG